MKQHSDKRRIVGPSWSRPFGRPAPAAIRDQNSRAGFTLLELLVVMVILGLLAAVATPQVMNYLGRAKSDAAAIQLERLSAVLDLYRLDVGRYPSQDEGLEALVVTPANAERWNGPYVTSRDSIVDPWGQVYVYRFPGDHGAYDLFTLGSDRSEGGDGEDRDVTSW